MRGYKHVIEHPKTMESNLIAVFEYKALNRGLIVRPDEAETIRGLVLTIIENILGQGGAGRRQVSGRRYTAREQYNDLDKAYHLCCRLADRAVQRARQGEATPIEGILRIGDKRVLFRTSAHLFRRLCPPPLPPLC